MKFESNALDIISIKSENFKAGFNANLYDLKNPAEEVKKLKETFDDIVENTNNLSEMKQFDEVIKNITEKCPAAINDITFIISEKMLDEKPIYDYFNKYSDIFFDKVERGILVENEFNKKEAPHIYIEKGQGQYGIKYESEYGRCYVKAFDSGYSTYTIDGIVSMDEMKKFTDLVKNVDMEEGYDNSGRPKNYEVNPLGNQTMVITVSKNNKNYEDYETSINTLSRNEIEQTRSYIKTEIPADNEKLLESILKISDEITDYCGTEQFITEFSEKILKELSEIKKDISEIPNNMKIQTDFHGEPHKIFSQILSENMESDCNINVTQNCTDTQFLYRNTGELSVTMDENIDTRISFSTDDINKNVTISYYGDMSDSFKKECVKNLEEMSNTVPQLSKINDYVIENIKHHKTFEKDIDI